MFYHKSDLCWPYEYKICSLNLNNTAALQLTLHLTGTLESAAYISHDWCYKFSQVGAGSPRQQWLSGQLSIFPLRGIPHRVSWNCRSYLRQIPSTSPNQTNHLATFLWRESKVRQQWPFLQMLAGIRNHRLEGLDLTILSFLSTGHLSGLGKSLGQRGWISQYLPRFDGARIQSAPALLPSKQNYQGMLVSRKKLLSWTYFLTFCLERQRWNWKVNSEEYISRSNYAKLGIIHWVAA